MDRVMSCRGLIEIADGIDDVGARPLPQAVLTRLRTSRGHNGACLNSLEITMSLSIRLGLIPLLLLAGAVTFFSSTSESASPLASAAAQAATNYNIKAFGAKGDGATVDSPAINKA